MALLTVDIKEKINVKALCWLWADLIRLMMLMLLFDDKVYFPLSQWVCPDSVICI